MVKVKVKKNIKPKITKQKQSQKTNVVVNISSDVIKKKRGRPAKRSKIEKPTTKPASQQPITQSYNQPIFKQSTPQQPSSLTSSILASQNIPKVIKEEVKEESTIRKALEDQNTVEAETKTNDLERVKVERIKKPKIQIKIEEPTRNALLGQLISEQGDDTEEIQQLIKFPKPPIAAFKPFDDNEMIPIKTTRKEPKINPLVSFSPSIEPVLLSQENKTPDLFSMLEEPIIEESQGAVEEGSQEEVLTNQQQEPEQTILEPTKAPNKITQSLQAEEPMIEIKSVDAEEIPIAESTIIIPTPFTQAMKKWTELKNAGLLTGSKYNKSKDILIAEIKSIEPSWDIEATGRIGGAKKKTSTTNIVENIEKKPRGRPPKRSNLVVEEV